jgi:hypothetical protein
LGDAFPSASCTIGPVGVSSARGAAPRLAGTVRQASRALPAHAHGAPVAALSVTRATCRAVTGVAPAVVGTGAAHSVRPVGPATVKASVRPSGLHSGGPMRGSPVTPGRAIARVVVGASAASDCRARPDVGDVARAGVRARVEPQPGEA